MPTTFSFQIIESNSQKNVIYMFPTLSLTCDLRLRLQYAVQYIVLTGYGGGGGGGDKKKKKGKGNGVK